MNMKRLSLVFAVLLLAFTQHVHAQYYSVNYDARTVAAMAAAFGTEVVAESYYREQVDDILKHYTAAEVAAAALQKADGTARSLTNRNKTTYVEHSIMPILLPEEVKD